MYTFLCCKYSRATLSKCSVMNSGMLSSVHSSPTQAICIGEHFAFTQVEENPEICLMSAQNLTSSWFHRTAPTYARISPLHLYTSS